MVCRGFVVIVIVAACRFEPGQFAMRDGSMIDAAVDVAPDAVEPRHCTLLLGSDHSCAVRSDHTLWCVGSNQFGELGRGGALGGSSTTVDQVSIGVVASAANRFFHTCASFADGSAKCWGQNDRGQLGDTTTTSNSTPTTVMNLSNVVEIGVGRSLNCARRANNTVTCWGDNAQGQLGDGTFTPQPTPTTSVTSLFQAPDVLEIGASHGCAHYADGTGACWGNNLYGQLGQEPLTNRQQATPMPINKVAQIASNGYSTGVSGGQTCGMRMNGTVACWGSNNFGQLGNGQTSTTPTATPVEVTGMTGAVEIVMGRYHVCVRHGAGGGSVSCWGHNDFGQLGDGSKTDRPAPTPVTLARPAVHIDASGFHTCALLDDDSVVCWGNNGSGQLGDTTQDERLTPAISTLCG